MPFETIASKKRARDRDRRIILSNGASILTKGLSQILGLALVPLTLHYLGNERYGLWLTINSFAGLLAFADFGLGNGLLNAISEAYGKNDRNLAREYVSSTLFILLGLAIVLAILFGAVYPWLNWPRIFNVQDAQAIAEAGPSMVIFIACMLVNIPLGVAQRVQLGYQQGFSNSLWQALGTIISLGLVVAAISLKANLIWLVLALVGIPTLVSILQSIAVFGYTHTWVRPNWACINVGSARKILQLGILFFVLQLACVLAFASDNIIVAQILGPAAVTEYGVPARLFSLLSLTVGTLLLPLWPAYGEAIARGDLEWVRKTLVKSLLVVAVGASLPAIVLVAIAPELMKVWVGAAAHPPFMLILGLGIWSIVSAIGGAIGMFLNGAGIVRFQVIFAFIMAGTALITKITLIGAVGISGVIWGTIIPYLLFIIIPAGIYIPRLLRRM